MPTINKERVLESQIVVSFDVESLFMNIPIEGRATETRGKSVPCEPHDPNTYTSCGSPD